MLFALGAVSSIWDSLQSLTASNSSPTTSAGQSQPASNPFDVSAGAQASGTPTTGFTGPGSAWSQISPQTMSALIEAQSQSGTANTAPSSPSDALQDLFSQIDGNGDGSISKSEFEGALGAGGTNIAAADDVFNKLDADGDGSVSLDELKNALQGSHHGHHHLHAGGSGDANSADGSDPNADPLLQALAGASSTSVTNSDGSTTTSITYADGSKVSLTTPAASASASASNSATSSYNLIDR
jgi:hypothetical protein